jgi:hypothetical protein
LIYDIYCKRFHQVEKIQVVLWPQLPLNWIQACAIIFVRLLRVTPDINTSIYISYSYFVISGALSSGHVTVTDGDCWLLLHSCRNVITQMLYQLWKVWSMPSLSPQIVSDVLLVSMWLSGLSSKEWHNTVGPSVVNPLFVEIYCHMLNGNQLVQLRGCKQTFTTLARIEVIWSIKPIWCIFIIQYFWYAGNSNKHRSNKTLVGAEILTLHLQNRRLALYHFS